MLSEPDDSFDFLFKIVLIGDMGVGKTACVHRFKNGAYIERQGTTIGVDFTMRTLCVNDKRVKLQIWDTGGQERFRTITQSYYRSAHGVIICYDITSKESFNNVRRWLDDVQRLAASNVVKLLVGTKCDCESDRQVSRLEGEELARQHQFIAFVECSSKENVNVDSAFVQLAEELSDRYSNGHGLEDDIIDPSSNPSSTAFRLGQATQNVGGLYQRCCGSGAITGGRNA